MTVKARKYPWEIANQIRQDLLDGTVRDQVIEDAMRCCPRLSIDVAERLLVHLFWVHYGYQPSGWEDWLRWVSNLTFEERWAFTALLVDVCEGDI